jgi:hypothetical protein
VYAPHIELAGIDGALVVIVATDRCSNAEAVDAVVVFAAQVQVVAQGLNVLVQTADYGVTPVYRTDVAIAAIKDIWVPRVTLSFEAVIGNCADVSVFAFFSVEVFDDASDKRLAGTGCAGIVIEAIQRQRTGSAGSLNALVANGAGIAVVAGD